MSLVAGCLSARTGVFSVFNNRAASRQLDLDVVRGVAILMAMGWHLGLSDGSGWVFLDWIMLPANTFGWVGVDLFFVLSGFLMGRIIFREYDKTGTFNSKRFLIRRGFKLWPVFYVFLMAQLLFGDNPWQSFFIQNAFHVQNYMGSSHSHLWSLAVEEHFYLALAFVAPFVLRRGTTPKVLAAGLASVIGLSLVLRFVGVLSGATALQIQTYTHFRLDGLSMGVLLALVSIYYPALMDRLLRIREVWLALSVAAVWFLATVEIDDGGMLGSTLGYLVPVVGSAAFMLLLYRAAWVEKLRVLLYPIGWLGVYSYALYLWHMAGARLAEIITAKVAPGLDSEPVQLVINYIFVIAIAVVITRFIEWPALSIRDRVIPGKARSL